MRRTITILTCLILAISSISQAETETIIIDQKYLMGDNDSKNDARRLCLFEAKRLISEKAGTYIESRTNVLNLQATKDEIKIYSAAYIEAEVINEEWKIIDETMTLLMKVKATVDAQDAKEVLEGKAETEDTFKNRMEYAEQYMEIINFREMMDKSCAETSQKVNFPGVTKEEFYSFCSGLTDDLELEKITVSLSVKHLTAEELKGLVAFYGSDIGMSVMNKLPILMAETQAETISAQQIAIKEFLEQIEAKNKKKSIRHSDR